MSGSSDRIHRVPDELLDFDDDQAVYYQGKRFTGVSFSETPIPAELSYVDGLQAGPAREWYPSGVLASETNYEHSVKHGEEREYGEDGHLDVVRMYEYDVLIEEHRGSAGKDA